MDVEGEEKVKKTRKTGMQVDQGGSSTGWQTGPITDEAASNISAKEEKEKNLALHQLIGAGVSKPATKKRQLTKKQKRRKEARIKRAIGFAAHITKKQEIYQTKAHIRKARK